MCDVTDLYLWLAACMYVAAFMQKSPTKETCILQKRPIFLRSLLIVATPYLYL